MDERMPGEREGTEKIYDENVSSYKKMKEREERLNELCNGKGPNSLQATKNYVSLQYSRLFFDCLLPEHNLLSHARPHELPPIIE